MKNKNCQAIAAPAVSYVRFTYNNVFIYAHIAATGMARSCLLLVYAHFAEKKPTPSERKKMLFKSWRVNLKNRAKVKVIFCYACLKRFFFMSFFHSIDGAHRRMTFDPRDFLSAKARGMLRKTLSHWRHARFAIVRLFLIPARTVNRKWFDVKICKNKKKRVTRKSLFPRFHEGSAG